MLIQKIAHRGRPNELAVYVNDDQLETLNSRVLADGTGTDLDHITPDARLQYGRNIFALAMGGTASRLVVDLEDGSRLDSDAMGREAVTAFVDAQDVDTFDPLYSPVDITFRVLSDAGDAAVSQLMLGSPTIEPQHIDQALATARIAATLCVSPPSHA